MRRRRWQHVITGSTVALAQLVVILAAAEADPIKVRLREGASRGFLVLSPVRGQPIAYGELRQKPKGSAVESRLLLHFRDGSLYDETVTFTQDRVFRLETYQQVQRGASLPGSMISLDRRSGRYHARTQRAGDEEKVASGSMDMPPDALRNADLRFLVGGAHAFAGYTGISRYTKDLDVFVRPTDHQRALDTLARTGSRTELSFPHWLGKAHGEDDCVDITFSSGNGLATVDDAWFEYAVEAPLLGTVLPLVPPEEMIWSKGFIMERERFDGADVAHLLRAQAHRFHWDRLLERFGPHWRVLLSHLVLFGFVYPDERCKIPPWVMSALLDRLAEELRPGGPRTPGLCQAR